MTKRIHSQILTLYLLRLKKKNRGKNDRQKLNVNTVRNEIALAKIEITETMSATFAITIDQLYDFVVETCDSKYDACQEIVKRYTENGKSLIIMISEVYKHVTNSSLKTRFTKIRNAIKPGMMSEATPPNLFTDSGDSDGSVSSQF